MATLDPTIENSDSPTIVLLGLNQDTIQYLGAYLGNKYRFVAINHKFGLRKLDSYPNILLFIINTDTIWIKDSEIVEKIRKDLTYENIPFLGISLKQHYSALEADKRQLYEDILLKPYGGEDLLTRIEVWIKTSLLLKNDLNTAQTYSLNSL